MAMMKSDLVFPSIALLISLISLAVAVRSLLYALAVLRTLGG
jgi:hypothetical protein